MSRGQMLLWTIEGFGVKKVENHCPKACSRQSTRQSETPEGEWLHIIDWAPAGVSTPPLSVRHSTALPLIVNHSTFPQLQRSRRLYDTVSIAQSTFWIVSVISQASNSTNGKKGHFASTPGSGDVGKTVVRCHEEKLQLLPQVKTHHSTCTCMILTAM